MDAIFDPQSSSIVGAWSLIVSIAGLILSLVGFGFTIWQLYKTQNSAKAASQAVQDLTKRTSLYDIVLELERSLTAVESANRSCRNETWSDVYGYCETARGSIHNAIISRDIAQGSRATELDDIHMSLSNVMTHITRAEAGKRSFPEKAKLSELLIANCEKIRSAQKAISVEVRQ